MAVITKQLALKIAKKLKAEIRSGPGRRHDIAEVYHEGRLIALFGIRRGSSKSLGHDHIPGQLYLTPHQARLLAECPLQRNDWIDIMAEKGML